MELYGHPRDLDEVASAFPNLKIIMAHFGIPFFDEATELMAKHENVFTDISFTVEVIEPKQMSSLIKTKDCRACNLCVLKCPQGAIRLENYEQLEALIEKHKRAEAGRSFRAFMQKERIGLADKLAMPAKLRAWGLG
jgi:ferredoxin